MMIVFAVYVVAQALLWWYIESFLAGLAHIGFAAFGWFAAYIYYKIKDRYDERKSKRTV